jgi:hypothetical protein
MPIREVAFRRPMLVAGLALGLAAALPLMPLLADGQRQASEFAAPGDPSFVPDRKFARDPGWGDSAVPLEVPSDSTDRLCCWADWWDVQCLVRGYYLNDQRIEWSGVECTFGAEAAATAVVGRRFDWLETTVEGEFYLNQPFDRNILVDTAERRSYLANYDVETFEISQLHLALQAGAWTVKIGKMETPFGRFYFPLYSNARLDAPFIRTESIAWRETGVLIGYRRGVLVIHAALTNGGEDRDANSSKALVSRLGFETEHLIAGVSVKAQDGLGSEDQKLFNNHAAVDLMFRCGRFTASGEVIYDEYGLRRPYFNPEDIFWGRSIYYRDLNYRHDVPLTGIGYYLDLGYQGEWWRCSLNYGEFYPRPIGHPQHDIVNRRGILKLDMRPIPWLTTYAACLLENGGYVAQADRARSGVAVLVGVEWRL